MLKSVWLLLGNFWGKLGNFLFHRLVTLVVREREYAKQFYRGALE